MVREVRGEVISIGDELITGKVGNSTAAFAARKLTEHGFTIHRITAIGDDPETIRESLEQALGRSDFAIISGGLGPTDDDITNEAVSAGLGIGLKFQPSIFKRVMERAGRLYSEEMGRKIASLPEGAKELNPQGNAAGYLLIHHRVPLFFLPGVPDQMEDHLVTRVIPWLENHFPHRPAILSTTLITFGLNETEINRRFLELDVDGVEIGYYPRHPEVHVVLTARGKDRDQAASILARAADRAGELIGPHLVSDSGESMEEVLGKTLAARGMTLAVAESCTGGLIASKITGVPGSSRWFDRGVVTYSNRSKQELLGVEKATLERFGAVSRPTALEMVRGILDRSEADCAIAVTGIAGPSGGSKEKPVGTVYIAVALGGQRLVHRFSFDGGRREIQLATAITAMDWLRRILLYDTDVPGHPHS